MDKRPLLRNHILSQQMLSKTEPKWSYYVAQQQPSQHKAVFISPSALHQALPFHSVPHSTATTQLPLLAFCSTTPVSNSQRQQPFFRQKLKSWRNLRHQTVRNLNIPIGLCQYVQIHSWMIQFHIWQASLLRFLILRCGDLNKPLSASLKSLVCNSSHIVYATDMIDRFPIKEKPISHLADIAENSD